MQIIIICKLLGTNKVVCLISQNNNSNNNNKIEEPAELLLEYKSAWPFCPATYFSSKRQQTAICNLKCSISCVALKLLYYKILILIYKIKAPMGLLRYLSKCAYFDKMLFRTACFYQWSWKLDYWCSLMPSAIWDILEAQIFVRWLKIEN